MSIKGNEWKTISRNIKVHRKIGSGILSALERSFRNEENLHHRHRSFRTSTQTGDGEMERWKTIFLACRLINRCERKGQKCHRRLVFRMKDGDKMTEVKDAQSGKDEWKIVKWLKEEEEEGFDWSKDILNTCVLNVYHFKALFTSLNSI